MSAFGNAWPSCCGMWAVCTHYARDLHECPSAPIPGPKIRLLLARDGFACCDYCGLTRAPAANIPALVPESYAGTPVAPTADRPC
jgi:hypothetical protein